jgi:hypothetical protein
MSEKLKRQAEKKARKEKEKEKAKLPGAAKS